MLKELGVIINIISFKGEKAMGLFTNKKKGCPFCGAPTPRLFPTKVEKMPICTCNGYESGLLLAPGLAEYLTHHGYNHTNSGYL